MMNPSVIQVMVHQEYKTNGRTYWAWRTPDFVHATWDAAKAFWRPFLKEGTDFMPDRDILIGELAMPNSYRADKIVLKLIEVKQ